MSDLTPTSLALLALISIRPWSAYELTRYMRNSTLRAIWPRAESHIYSEVKRLERFGLASCRIAHQGSRKRSVYSITPEGEEALQEWVAEPSRRFVYESEAMLKVAYPEHGELDDLRRTVDGIREEALGDLTIMRRVFEEIVDREQKLLPGRRAYNALVSRFILEMIEARLRWVERANHYLASWEEVTTDEAKEASGAAFYRESLDRVLALLETWQPRRSHAEREPEES